MKKLLMITYDKYPHEGGKSTHMKYLIEGLSKLGIETKVVSFDDVNPLVYSFLKLLIQPTKLRGLDCYLYYRLKIGKCLFRAKIKEALKKESFEMISTQDAISCSLLNGLSIGDANVSLTMHTYFGLEYTLDNEAFDDQNSYYLKLYNEDLRCLNIVNGIIAVDTRIKEHVNMVLEKHKRKDDIKVFSIKNFLNSDLFVKKNKIEDTLDIICVRRLVEKNGVIHAVRAMKGLEKNIRLHIIGDGPEREKIEQFVNDNNLQNQVTLYGSVKNEEILQYYQMCNVCIVPSITVNGLQEATSISALEGMASSMPVIASAIGGLAELITDKENGLLSNEGDEQSIRDCINWISDNKNQAEIIGCNARDYIVKNHSHIAAAQQYLRAFEK